MIKVQPARSRVVKTETPTSLTLTNPPKGFVSLGGFLILASTAWLGLGCWGLFVAYLAGSLEWEIAALVVMMPAVLTLPAGLSICRSGWTLERTAESFSITRVGLWKTRVRSWAAGDISSLWVEDVEKAKEFRCFLILGFRNGRNEELLSGTDVEEFRWLAALLSDSRGSRRASEQPAQAAEPVRRRPDASAIPTTLASRRFESGVELRFLPLLQWKKIWLQTVAPAFAATLVLVILELALEGTRIRIPIGPLFAGMVFVTLGVLLYRYVVLSRAAEILIDNGALSIHLNQGRGSYQFAKDEVEFIQTFRGSGETELQFLIRGQPKLRLFKGRPAEELEWAARFLRVALKARPEEEAAKLKVDASAGDCQVCGEKMETRVIFCAKCRTPHHEECWSYVGTCSTYGCREIRFTRS